MGCIYIFFYLYISISKRETFFLIRMVFILLHFIKKKEEENKIKQKVMSRTEKETKKNIRGTTLYTYSFIYMLYNNNPNTQNQCWKFEKQKISNLFSVVHLKHIWFTFQINKGLKYNFINQSWYFHKPVKISNHWTTLNRTKILTCTFCNLYINDELEKMFVVLIYSITQNNISWVMLKKKNNRK